MSVQKESGKLKLIKGKRKKGSSSRVSLTSNDARKAAEDDERDDNVF
jgi:hypothetical protein